MFRLLIPIWQRLALNSLVSGDYQKAEKYFLKIHRYASDKGGFEYNLALIRIAQSNYEEAEVFLKKDLSLYGESYHRTRVMGDLYYIWGRRDQAKNWYKKALADCNDTVDKNLLKRRIQKCNSEKTFAGARASHKSYDKGNELLKEKNYAQALENFSKAVEQDNTNFQALNNKGSILMNQFNNFKDSLDCFEKALSLSSLPAINSNILKARAALDKGNIDG